MAIARDDDHVVDTIVLNEIEDAVPVRAVSVPSILVHNEKSLRRGARRERTRSTVQRR